ncbi:DNA-binding CsgD family transcriptional regulator [Inquilinus ginsengisoli]|uniref:helix-turn-helix transcriptional regulator n=1 Tax=Inquilinus ginsengisoli TaxID=363840 RepID=UPI003D21301D
MDRADAILKAAQRIYDTVASPDAWPDAVAAIAAAAHGQRGSLLVEDQPQRRADLMIGWRWDPAHLKRMSAPGAPRTAPWAATLPLGRAVRSLALKPERDFIRSDFYNEVVRPNGDFYGVVALVRQTPTHSSYVAVRRVLGAPDFTDRDVEALQAVLPHLARILELRQTLGGADLRLAGAMAVLDRIDLGLILCDAESRPAYLNRRAEALVARPDGLSAGSAGIAAALPQETRRLRHAVAMAAAAGAARPDMDAAARAAAAGTRMRLSRPSGARPLLLTVIPLRQFGVGDCRPQAQVAIFIIDPEHNPTPAPALLQEMFGLTAAEAGFAVEIGQGDGIQAAAGRLSISDNTARTHLSRIFEKTGTNRQAELVRLLMQCSQPSLPPG